MRLAIIATFLMCFFAARSQEILDLSFEFQAYPTGLIPGIHLEKSINNKSTLLFRLGYNWFRHRDLGVHDDERGGGIGGTVGYKRFFKEGYQGWSLAVKNDVWWNEVDWYDIGVNDNRTEGETSITVLQPTAELGYTFVKNESLIITPTLAFGVEWNVRTEGEPTGEGPIVLIEIIYSYTRPNCRNS